MTDDGFEQELDDALLLRGCALGTAASVQSELLQPNPETEEES